MSTPCLDFIVGCDCPACELAVDLWYGDERRHPRIVWEKFWEDWRQNFMSSRRPCSWQLRRFEQNRAIIKPAAYKIC